MQYSIMKGEDRKQRSNGQENWNSATEKGETGTVDRGKEDGRQGTDHIRQGTEDMRQGAEP